MTARPVLELQAVSYASSGQRLLDNVTLSIQRDERVAIVGESGSGKSMLLRLAMGLSEPLSGNVRLFDEDIAACSDEARRRLLRMCGISFQSGSLIRGLSVGDNLWLALGAPAAARSRLRRRLDRIGFEFGIDHLFGASVDLLSQGEARMVELARAFVHDPQFVLLDGALDGMPAQAALLERCLRRHTVLKPRALLLVTQDAALAFRTCERIYRLEEGRLAAQSVPELAPEGVFSGDS